jgi:hypothetical protein
MAASLVIAAAAFCAWGALCLLFWQGSWQLLYHPTSQITRTPASAGLAFDPVGFSADDAGEPQLKGWWVPAAADSQHSRYTVLYLHGRNGNLSNTTEELATLHEVGVSVLAIDYRGYGQSRFERPSEIRWHEDAESALRYLTETRHIAPGAIVLDGKDLGANLALEIGAEHRELAGVVLESPLVTPMKAIFDDPRARLVPAHSLVRDRFGLDAPAAALRIQSLWFIQDSLIEHNRSGDEPEAFRSVSAPRMLVWLPSSPSARRTIADSLSRWVDDLPK